MVSVAALAALAGAAAAPAGATNECRGLPVCVPVAGPWVGVPAAGSPPRVRYLLRCPGRGRIVGGLDALVADRALDVAFLGRLGSPVNPGVSTRDAAVFEATATAAAPRATSFRPLIGCIPTSGGGGRGTTARGAPPAAFPAGEPVAPLALDLRLARGTSRTALLSCPRRSRLVAAAAAAAFWGAAAPGARELASVRSRVALRDGRAAVLVARAAGAPPRARVEVQVLVVCTIP